MPPVVVDSQIYSASGSPIGGEFQVNTYTTGGELSLSVASDPNGKNLVVAWTSNGSAGSDTSAQSIQSQRYLPEPGTSLLQMAGLLSLLGLADRRRVRA